MAAMKYLFGVCLLLVVGCEACAPGLMDRPTNNLRRQCFLPVKYVVAADVVDETRAAIIRGFSYWNSTLGREVFEYLGTDDIEAGPREEFLPVTVTEESYSWCGITRYHSLFNGCIFRNDVILKINSENCCSDNKFETVVRHEAGHVLGLDHDPSSDALMYYRINSKLKHPRNATEVEKADALRRLP